MYSCVLFDMDGTLVDTYEGIFHAYRWTMEQLGLPFEGEPFVRTAIGAPLLYVFEDLCGMNRETARKAVSLYRDYYARKGRHQLRLYDGMEQALRQLKQAGCFLGTATLKKESFAKEILEELGLSPYFDAVCGMDEDDRLTKADLIRRGMEAAGANQSETVLVGDSEFDITGAREAGVDFLAVTYGFGFRGPDARKALAADMTAESPLAVARLLLTPGGKGIT